MGKRIFISFAIEDSNLRDFLVGQGKNERSPFEFVDMSVKEPWDDKWKTRCKRKIKGCDGMIAIVTKKTRNATGQLWEVTCAKEEKVPIIGIWGYTNDKSTFIPNELRSIRIINWTWKNILSFLNSL